MNRPIATLAFLLAALTSTAASAQVDAIVTALNRCRDADRAPAERIRYCMSIISARGVAQDEIAFADIDLAGVYRSQGEQDQELDAYNSAIAALPEAWQARAGRARIFLACGQIDEALSDYAALSAIDPDRTRMFRPENGVGYRTIEDGSDAPHTTVPGAEQNVYAAERSEIGLALKRALTTRCRVRALNNTELAGALADCNAAVKMDSRDAASLDSRGLVEFRRGEFSAALADYSAAAAVDAKNPSPLYVKGITEQRLGRVAEGKADIVQATSISPKVGEFYSRAGIPVEW